MIVRILLRMVSLTMLPFILSCSVNLAGNTSETGNARIAGIIYEPDGVTPAQGATVIIRSQNSLAAIAGVVGEPANGTADTVVTDNAGRYSFDTTINEGIYSIEATKDANAAFSSPVNVGNTPPTMDLDPMTLKPTGTVTGTIHLIGGGDPTEVYVLVFGIDRFTQVNSEGYFSFGDLGEGTYHLKIITTLDDYSAFDTVGIPVVSSDTTNLGTINLSYSGIQAPQNISVTYDPVTMAATLHWDRVDHPQVKYYIVYRMDTEILLPNDTRTFLYTKRLNDHQITDTFFVDSTIPAYNPPKIPESVFYRVVTVDSAENEGSASATVELIFKQLFSTVNIGDLSENHAFTIVDYMIAGNGDIYITGGVESCIYITDSSFNNKESIPTMAPGDSQGIPVTKPFIPGHICRTGNPDLLYVENFITATVFVFDNMNTCIDSIDDPSITAQGISDLEVINGSLYVLTSEDSVISFGSEGRRKTAWYTEKGQCIADGGGNVVIGKDLGYNGELCRYDSSGNLLSSIPMEYTRPMSIAIDTAQQYLYMLTIPPHSSPELQLYNRDMAIIDRYPYSYTVFNNSLQLLGNGTLLVHDDVDLIRFNVFNK